MARLNLSARFTAMITTVFLIGILAGGAAHWRALQGRARDEITVQGLLLIESMNAVRNYTSAHVRPLLADDLYTNAEFIPETVPAFSARTVFENFRGQIDFETYQYKEASLKPTNPLDLADDFETELLLGFYDGTRVGEVSGYRTLSGSRVFYIARPLAITSESCLECHSTPDVAPASLIATYGDQGGFGWELGEVVAMQMIYVPAQEVFDAAFRTFSLVMSVFVITFAIFVWLINTLLNRYVIQPVHVLSDLAQKISMDEDISTNLRGEDLQIVVARPDELGNLAQVFKKMAAEVYARTERLRQQLQELRIEIDEIRRKEQVSELVETEFFNDLQARAREIRQRRQEREKRQE
jgi:HAMP domain-containing protein